MFLMSHISISFSSLTYLSHMRDHGKEFGEYSLFEIAREEFIGVVFREHKSRFDFFVGLKTFAWGECKTKMNLLPKKTYLHRTLRDAGQLTYVPLLRFGERVCTVGILQNHKNIPWVTLPLWSRGGHCLPLPRRWNRLCGFSIRSEEESVCTYVCAKEKRPLRQCRQNRLCWEVHSRTFSLTKARNKNMRKRKEN